MRGFALALLLSAAAPSTDAHPTDTVCDFSNADDGTSCVLTQHGEAPGPRLQDGRLVLLHAESNQSNSTAFERTAEGAYKRWRASFTLSVDPGADGSSLLFLDTATYGESGPLPDHDAWEEPNLPACFAIGIDLHNPPGGDPFNALGNIYDRPQREVSLHLNGVEVANALSPAEFRIANPVPVEVEVEFAVGGAYVTVQVRRTVVYERLFIPELLPIETRVAFAARSSGESTRLSVDDLLVSYTDPVDTPAEAPRRVQAFAAEAVTSSQQRATVEVDFSAVDLDEVGRVIATLTLGAPEGGIDAWDHGGSISIFDDEGNRYEVLRFITPFGRGYTWKVDVTDLLTLFSGKRQMEAYITTWQKGWAVSFDLDFYPGPLLNRPTRVINLWQGEPILGDPDQPIDEFFAPRTIEIPTDADRLKLRTTVTGHGMSPNSKNAAEFMPADREIIVNGASYENRLWKTDVYLNPCRPQGGTWKYSRAGWAPGDVVLPWEIDITHDVTAGETATIEYHAEPYINNNRGQASPPIHWIDAQVVMYERNPALPKHYLCEQAQGRITIDGKIGEEEWANAAWTDLFVDIEGDGKPKPRFETRAKMLWDEEYLYVSAYLWEPHVWGTLTEHDQIVFYDNDFEIFIDPDGDTAEYYEIEINVLNTIFDLFLVRTYIDQGPALHEWHCTDMLHAIHADGTLNDHRDTDQGWSCEFAIPWKTLKPFAHKPSPPRPGDTWRINFSRVEWQHEIVDGTYRRVPDTPENNWVWSPQGVINMHVPEHWGYLEFLGSAE